MKHINTKGASWDSMFLTFVKILTTLTSIVVTKILSVGLSLTDYGTYSQAILIVSIGTTIILFGLGDALNYFYNNQSIEAAEEKREKIVNTIFFIEIILGICFMVLVIVLRNIFSIYFSNAALAGVLTIIAIKPMLENVIYFYQVLYISTGKAKVIAIRNLIVSVLKIVAIYISVHIFKNVNMIFISLILLDLLQVLFFQMYFQNKCFKINPFKILTEYIKPIFSYGIPMGIYALTNILTRNIDQLVIGKIADTETLAIYANCSKLLPFDIIVASFATVLIPYIMRCVSINDTKKTVKIFSNYMKIGYYSVWTFGVAILTVTAQVISFLYTDEYLVGENVFICYILDSMLRFASMHLILTASGKAKVLMKYSMIALGLNAVLNIVLYYFMGILGPAIATLITAIIYTYLVLRKTIKTMKVKWLDVLDLKDMIITLGALVLVGGCIHFINNYLLQIGINKYVLMMGSMAGVCLFSLLFNGRKIKKCLYEINKLKL